MTTTQSVRSRMTRQQKTLRNRLARKATKLDRLEEEYRAAGDWDNARSVGLEADALWAQVQEMVEKVKAKARS